jgi:hypothetical protein
MAGRLWCADTAAVELGEACSIGWHTPVGRMPRGGLRAVPEGAKQPFGCLAHRHHRRAAKHIQEGCQKRSCRLELLARGSGPRDLQDAQEVRADQALVEHDAHDLHLQRSGGPDLGIR